MKKKIIAVLRLGDEMEQVSCCIGVVLNEEFPLGAVLIHFT